MNKKRIISAVLALMTVLACLVGCGQKQTDGPAEEGDLLARIQARGSIIVAMEGTWAPWTYHDESDRLVGYDVEAWRKGHLCGGRMGRPAGRTGRRPV